MAIVKTRFPIQRTVAGLALLVVTAVTAGCGAEEPTFAESPTDLVIARQQRTAALGVKPQDAGVTKARANGFPIKGARP